MRLIETTLKRLWPAVSNCFANDASLAKYHISPGSGRHMARHTYTRLLRYERHEPLRYYHVWHERKCIGFVVLSASVPVLCSFGINRQYRTREVLQAWLKAIGEELKEPRWMVGLNDRNKRAIRFFERNNFYIHSRQDKTILLWQ